MRDARPTVCRLRRSAPEVIYFDRHGILAETKSQRPKDPEPLELRILYKRDWLEVGNKGRG